MQLLILKNDFELVLTAHFLDLNLTFAVCRIREALKLSNIKLVLNMRNFFNVKDPIP